MKRIAFCLTGAIEKQTTSYTVECQTVAVPYKRTGVSYIASYNSIQEYIIKQNKEYIIDFFIHCWKTELKDELIQLYKPNKFIFESNSIYKDEIQSKCKNIDDYEKISQALSIKKVIQLVESYSQESNIQYDSVFFYSPNLLLWKNLKFNEYTNNNIIYLLKNENENEELYFYMSYSNAILFSFLYNSINTNPPHLHYWIKNFINNYMYLTIEDIPSNIIDYQCLTLSHRGTVLDPSEYTFIILHHSSSSTHTEILKNCLESIRAIYKTNRILICKTSTSIIPDDFISKYSIEIKNTPQDGSTIIGGIYTIVKDPTINNYILIHDSIYLMNKLPTYIIDNPLYYLWHFDGATDGLINTGFLEPMIEYLRLSTFTEKEQHDILELYNTYSKWTGCFGPSFGGKRSILKIIFDKLNLNTSIYKYTSPSHITCFERFLPCLFIYLKIWNASENQYSVNGSIYNHPMGWQSNFFSFEQAKQINKYSNYNSYFYKIWMGRH